MYEYIKLGGYTSSDGLENAIARYAKEGWRLVNAYCTANYHYAFMERKEPTLQDEPDEREI